MTGSYMQVQKYGSKHADRHVQRFSLLAKIVRTELDIGVNG